MFLPVEDYVYLDHEDQAKYTMGEQIVFKLKEQYRGRTREARFHFRTALRIDPRNSWAWKQVIRSAALF